MPSAPDIAIIVDKYAQIKQRKEDKGSCHTKSLSVLQLKKTLLTKTILTKTTTYPKLNAKVYRNGKKINKHSDPRKPESNPRDPFNDDLSADFLLQKSSLLAKNQKTLLEFTKPNTSVLEKDMSL